MSDLPSHQIVAGGSRDMKIALTSPPVAQFECSDVRNLPGGKGRDAQESCTRQVRFLDRGSALPSHSILIYSNLAGVTKHRHGDGIQQRALLRLWSTLSYCI